MHKNYSPLLLAREYLENVKVNIIGEGIIIPLLKGFNFKEIRVIENPVEKERLKKRLRGMDVVIGGYGHEEQKDAARAASELGMPLITYPVITTILPYGISFEEIEFPSFTDSTFDTKPLQGLRGRGAEPHISNTLIRTFQVIELIKLFTGSGEPYFPPNAVELDFDPLTLDFEVKKLRLTVR
jgi:hypothetical protein